MKRLTKSQYELVAQTLKAVHPRRHFPEIADLTKQQIIEWDAAHHQWWLCLSQLSDEFAASDTEFDEEKFTQLAGL